MANDNDNKNKDQDLNARVQNALLDARSVIISGEINQKLAEDVCSKLLVLAQLGGEPIQVFINSQGGHVEAGDTIHDMLQFVKPRIIMIGTGWVASAGMTIYLAAEKADRFCLPNTRFLIHQPMGGAQGQATDIKIEADEIIKMRGRLNRLIAEATGQPLDRVEKDTLRNYWLNTDEAKEYGILNRVVKKAEEIL